MKIKGEFHTSHTQDCAAVFWDGGRDRRGSAEANRIHDAWWISRVLIQPSSERGMGIGSKVLKLLIKEVKNAGGKLLLVAPGGYDSDPRVPKFYEKNGFIANMEEPGIFEMSLIK